MILSGVFVVNLVLLFALLYFSSWEKDQTALPHRHSSKRKLGANCNETDTVCITNRHCLMACRERYLTCNNENICMNEDSHRQTICNDKHGIVPILHGDYNTGTTDIRCVSLAYPFIWNDDDQLKPGICVGGKFEINLLAEAYDPYKCICPNKLTVLENLFPICAETALFP